MANFQYANNPQTTLSGAVTVGASAITVASAADFPTQGKFTIIIDSEILLVTGTAGTTWTVTRGYDGTSAAAHNNNATVTGILTKASFLNAHAYDPRAYGAVGDGTTDDATALQAMLDDAPAGATLRLPAGSTYLVATALSITKAVHIEGYGATMKAGADGLNEWVSIGGGLVGVSIRGVAFDDDDRGRTVIHADAVDDLLIEGCSFTGYSDAFGSGGSDSAIRLGGTTGVTQARIIGNNFQTFGPSATALNRCITLNASCDDIVIGNNVMTDVRQGIVISGTTSAGRITITGNIFRDVTDNSIYILNGVTSCVISGNMFMVTSTSGDEGIVMKDASNITISGNVFRNIPNKSIAYEGACTSIDITGNTFSKTVSADTAGNFLSYRDTADTLTDAIFSNNIVRGEYWGNVTSKYRGLNRVTFSDNIFDVTDNDVSLTEILKFEGSNDRVLIVNNQFRNGGTSPSTYGWTLLNATAATNFVIDGNRYDNAWGRFPGSSITPSIAIRNENLEDAGTGNARTKSPTNKVLYGTAAPTGGQYFQGDIVFNTAPTAAGTLAWVCVTTGTPGTWKAVSGIAA